MKTEREFTVHSIDGKDFEDLLGRIKRHESLKDADWTNLADILAFVKYLQHECRWTAEEVAMLKRAILDRKIKKKGEIAPENSSSTDENKKEKKEEQKQEEKEDKPEEGAEKTSGEKLTHPQDRPGRRSATDLEATCIHHYTIEGLSAGCACPLCGGGTLTHRDPITIPRIMGKSPLEVTLNEVEGLRCDTCLAVFRAEVPASLYDEAIGHFDFTAVATLMMLRYEFGTPFYRLERYIEMLGYKVGDSAMWDSVYEGTAWYLPLFREYLRQAANGAGFGFDDVSARVIDLTKEIKADIAQAKAADKNPDEVRRGVHTSCFVVKTFEGHSFSIYFTGRHHCGEKVEDLLAVREDGLPELKTMSDAASTNKNFDLPKGKKIIPGNCWEHARKKFDDIKENFPEQCGFVLEKIRAIFHNEAIALASGLSDEDRLAFHQSESAPIGDEIYSWLEGQEKAKLFEPNSQFGQAAGYMKNQKHGLTEFLRTAGILLHNNDAERSGKTPKRHEKNSQAFKSETGALTGDIIMTLASAAKHINDNPYEYLLFCMRYHQELRKNPQDFLAWNWRNTEARLKAAAPADSPPSPPKDWRDLVATHTHRCRPVEVSRLDA